MTARALSQSGQLPKALMKMRSLVLGSALSLIATAASAAIVTETFTGTVTGVDTAGFFVTAGASLDTTFTAQYFWNTANGISNNSTGFFEQHGGSRAGTTSPSIGANLIINGITYSTNGNADSQLFLFNSDGGIKFGAFSEVNPETTSGADMFTWIHNVNGVGVPFPTSVSSPFSTYTVQVGDFVGGGFTIGGDSLTLTPTTVELSSTVDELSAGVPEPSTWAMMILGFAGIGFLAYRRKLGPKLMAA
jgi:hypothetical protein